MKKVCFVVLMSLLLQVAPQMASAQKLTVNEISNFLNAMRGAKAKFVQSNPDKTLAQGVLYIKNRMSMICARRRLIFCCEITSIWQVLVWSARSSRTGSKPRLLPAIPKTRLQAR